MGSLVTAFSQTLFNDAWLIPSLHTHAVRISLQFVLFSHYPGTDIPSSQHTPLLQALHEAVAEGHPEPLKRAAHNLKGSSNNLGAHTVAALSAELETIGKNGTVERAARLVTRLEQE